MPEEFRFDRGQIASWARTPEGFLRVHGTFSRTGCQTYQRADGTKIVEYRSPEEVSRKDAILSIGGLPLTLEHPPELLTPANVRQYQRGSTGTVVHYDNGFVKGTVTITDAEAIASVERGDTRELSLGYRVQVDHTPGVDPATGERFDARQRNISANHLALTREARSGPAMRLAMDSAQAVDPFSPTTPHYQEANEMSDAVKALGDVATSLATSLGQVARQDGKGMKAPPMEAMDPNAEEVDTEDPMEREEEMEEDDSSPAPTPKSMKSLSRDRGDSAAVSRAEYNRVVGLLEASEAAHQADLGRMDALAQRLDELEQDIDARTDSAGEAWDERLDAMLELLDQANTLAGERLDHKGLTPREIQVLAMEKAGIATDRFDGQSDDYVAAAFDLYCETPPSPRVDHAQNLERALGSAASTAGGDPRDAARKAMEASVASTYQLHPTAKA